MRFGNYWDTAAGQVLSLFCRIAINHIGKQIPSHTSVVQQSIALGGCAISCDLFPLTPGKDICARWRS
jgi:hypothetical protein